MSQRTVLEPRLKSVLLHPRSSSPHDESTKFGDPVAFPVVLPAVFPHILRNILTSTL